MQTFSKYFTNDIIDSKQKLKPLILITDFENKLVLALSQDSEQIYDNNGNMIDFITCIDKVSNIKISNDYDSKTLKINRLRCTLYNYYDVNTKLTKYISNNFINYNMYLYYKSPTSNVINFSELAGDYDCALVYNGSISRIVHNEKNIQVTAEDRTELQISDKSVPYLSVDKLDFRTRERILDNYTDDKTTVPMTFGKVDKAFVLPHLQENSDRVLEVHLDFHPTAGNYKTAKIPKLFDTTPTNDKYCLYVKKDNDYIILEHHENSVYQQEQKNSKIELYTKNFSSLNWIIPELQVTDESKVFDLWSVIGYHQRQVENVIANDGSILDIAGVNLGSATDNEFANLESINNNGNYEKIWYRQEDGLSLDSLNFDTGLKHYENTMGLGRWIILKLTKGIGDRLINLQKDGNYIGNTFLMCNWEMYQSEDGSTPNNDSLESQNEKTGFFVAPIALDVWKDQIIPDISSILFEPDGTPQESGNNKRRHQAQLNRILLETEDDIQDAQGVNNITDTNNYLLTADFAPEDNTYVHAPISLNKDEAVSGQNNYWGSSGGSGNFPYSSPPIKIQGTYYGPNGSDDSIMGNEADSHDHVAIFEFYPPYWHNTFHPDANNYQQGLKMNNIGFLHSVLIEDLQEEEIYASIIGRKNNLFTEQSTSIENIEDIEDIEDIEEYEEIVDYSLNTIISGANGEVIDEETFVNSWFNVIDTVIQECIDRDMFFQWSTPPIQDGAAFYNKDINDLNNDDDVINIQEIFNTAFETFKTIDDSAMTNIHSLYSEYLWRVHFAVFLAWDSNMWSYNGLETQLGGGAAYIAFGKLSPEFHKCVAAKAYEYFFQRDSEYLQNNRFTFHYQSTMFDGDIDATDLINSYLVGYNWNDMITEEETTLENWINNFYVYFDQLTYAITRSVLDMTYEWNWFPGSTFEDMSEYMPALYSISYLQASGVNIGSLETDILIYSGQQQDESQEGEEEEIVEEETEEEEDTTHTTDGIIKKPSDIVMNILVNEMGYGKLLDEQNVGQDIIIPDYKKFDIEAIKESRNAHNWEMGFSINEKTDGKKLIENILKESKSYPKFTSSGKFSLLTIKESYTYDDIDVIIDTDNIISYKFSQTKREDIMTSLKMFYRYDYGIEKYNNYVDINIGDVFPEWEATGYNNYNTTRVDTYKEINLKYHTNKGTVNDFSKYTLMNNCNVHNVISMKLSLNNMNLEVGDKIHFSLINNETMFNMDYSKVSYLNGQPVYPLWVIMETNVRPDSIEIKAYQLHYLGIDGNHGFIMPDEIYEVRGNINEFNTSLKFTDNSSVPNWNYNPNATVDSGLEIPYFDCTRDGSVNVNDIISLINEILEPTNNQQFKKRIARFNHNGTLSMNNVLNVVSIVNLVNIILHNGTE